MKKLPLENPSYRYIERSFKEWLDILGYSAGTVYGMPNLIREFLHFLEQEKIQQLNQIRQKHFKKYYQKISQRSHERRGGALSNNYLNKHVQALEKFLEYLHQKGMEDLPALGLRQEKLQRPEITVFTPKEIGDLYKATEKETLHPKQEALNARDRAMLSIYYGCGLRRNEGVHLCTGDINLDRRILHVKRGKNYKERFVPFNRANAKYLEAYLYDYRPQLLADKKEDRFFISVTGKPMIGNSLYGRLKLLQLQTDFTEKHLTLHNLRHSIATHLLAAGMPLEKISRFLGHSSLESTQIYTHLLKEL